MAGSAARATAIVPSVTGSNSRWLLSPLAIFLATRAALFFLRSAEGEAEKRPSLANDARKGAATTAGLTAETPPVGPPGASATQGRSLRRYS